MNLLSNSTLPSISLTKQLHSHLITSSTLSNNLQLLINSYSIHDDLLSARLLLYQTRTRQPVILYNSLIRSHARTRHFSHAFSLFNSLLRSSTKPDSFTFATSLRACADDSNLIALKAIQGVIISSGFGSDLIPITTLISSYAKLGVLDDAVQVFDGIPQPDLVVYNTMLSGFGYAGFWQSGLDLFHGMRHYGYYPDGYSFVGLISCFWDPNSIRFARGVHGLVLKEGLDSNAHIRSVLVCMYTRLNCVDLGYQVFREISNPDLVTWSAVITGYSQADKCYEALALFREMNESSIKRPDRVLIASILSACASTSAIVPAKEIHGHIFRVGLDWNIQVSCALIDLYAKCGFMQLCLRVFETMHDKDPIAYNTIISGLGSNGFGVEAIGLFNKMLEDGFKPNNVTFSGILCACAHSGLLEEGSDLFRRMREEFRIEPEMEHYVYMVKLMCLVGKLDEAYELIKGMPILTGSGSGVWGALLWGCGLHGRSDLGKMAGRVLSEIDPKNSAYRVMLSNVYANEEKWEDVEILREKMEGEKVIGLSWSLRAQSLLALEVQKNKIYNFITGSGIILFMVMTEIVE